MKIYLVRNPFVEDATYLFKIRKTYSMALMSYKQFMFLWTRRLLSSWQRDNKGVSFPDFTHMKYREYIVLPALEAKTNEHYST